jgi:putative toxin-antitoxin system antitoxin component (TIGR02293 family)
MSNSTKRASQSPPSAEIDRLEAEGLSRSGQVKGYDGYNGSDQWFDRSRNDLELHEAVVNGVDVVKLLRFIRDHKAMTTDELAPALRVSKRTLSRLTEGESTTLNVSQGEGLVGLLQSIQLGTRVFGTQEAALQWFRKPAIGLEGKRPIELLSTSFGTALVLDLLTRIQFGVYA